MPGTPIMRRTRSTRGKLEVTSSVRRSMRTRGQPNGLEIFQLRKTILSWLIYTKTILENTIVRYMNPKLDRAVLEGTIKSNGILCHCCSKILTVTKFQQHAGYEGPRPYANIFIESGVPLLACMVNSWEKTEHTSVHPVQDDACVKIKNKGDFRCCSKCGFKYDLHCKDKKVKQDVLEVSWLCSYCICKCCEKVCADEDGFITCSLCEKCYHWKCYSNGGFIDLNLSFTEFCDNNCKKVYEKLGDKIGTKNELGNGFSWTLLRKINHHDESDILSNDEHLIAVCHSKLAIARSVMDECFQSTAKTSGIDRNNFNYQNNFKGSYTAVLEKDDEVISMACLRIHGQKLTEIPFIATRENYRKQGMCKRLMLGIESILYHLEIENIVITSTKEMVGVWIRNYAYKRIESTFEEDLKNTKTLMCFNNATRLQKTLTVNSEHDQKQKCG